MFAAALKLGLSLRPLLRNVVLMCQDTDDSVEVVRATQYQGQTSCGEDDYEVIDEDDDLEPYVPK
ncbi:unnamed protein product, partial [Notodromas monacha]